MKKLSLAIALLFCLTALSQNEDKLRETTTTKTTVKSNSGQKVDVKKQVTTKEEKLELENNRQTNQNVKRSPQLSKSTTFSVDDYHYNISPDKNGYVMKKMTKNGEELYGKIRRMPDKDFYILVGKNENSFGYFDEEGNFVVESYDANADGVVLKKYTIKK